MFICSQIQVLPKCFKTLSSDRCIQIALFPRIYKYIHGYQWLRSLPLLPCYLGYIGHQATFLQNIAEDFSHEDGGSMVLHTALQTGIPIPTITIP
jgi:hypothetical protein